MPQVTYPGVYIQEVPSGVRTIAPVSTSICAFVDYFREGPMNEAVAIDGKASFDRIFGGLDADSEASYAIDQFFKNGGTRAYVVRVASGTPAVSRVTVRSHPRQGVAQVDVLRVEAASEGSWGDALRVRVSHNADNSFNLAVSRYDGVGADAKVVAAEPAYLNLSVDPTSPRHVEKVVNDASALIRVVHLTPTDDRLPGANGTVGRQITLDPAGMAALHTGGNKTFTVQVTDPGPGADPTGVHTATLDFDNTTANPAPTTPKGLRAKIEAAIQAATDAAGATHPLLAGATVQLIEGSTGYRFVVEPNRRAREFAPQLVLDIGNATGSTGGDLLGFTGAGASDNVQDYVAGTTIAAGSQAGAANMTGNDGTLPNATALAGSPGEPPTGMYALAKTDLFNLLCIPRAAALTDAQADALIGDALTFCEERRAMLIVDIPESRNTVQEILDWIDDNANYRHRNAAVYFPRLRVPDPLDEFRLKSVGAGGTVAGIYARTDATRGVWKAPAGLEASLRGVSELDFRMTDGDNGVLNPLAVNAIRVFPIHGQVVWGARTLDGADATASEWKYISIRRTALMIEESLFRGTKWVVFEPNDEPTWAKVRQNIGAFMMSLFRQGAFQGSTPDKAFYVKCDGETTTANDRNLGIVNIEVGFAPLKPAEFVVIKIQQIPDV
ncbi:MAG TPA: phage tail sheath C-terminal domain-containing protein [Solirubrobacteraceae bacterium]|nr:phage tail sheath C-terminal domain-containing protein [Solirubrobacteraceae bacterium]